VCCAVSAVLTDEQVDRAVAERGLRWRRSAGALEKVVRCHRFTGALGYVNAVAVIAEEADHHPDIAISWDTVTLRLVTHAAGGITASDLDLAGAIDGLDDDAAGG